MILRTAHLTKRFGAVTALDDVSFDLRAGEIHALCGENGAGKSTLIKVLSGVHPYGSYQGLLEVDGHEARLRSVRDATAAGIAVIHQELSFVGPLSIADNIYLGAEPTRWAGVLDAREARRGARALLSRLGVELDPDLPMSSLGVGEQQLVEIAKALARDSRILILDEPTAALARREVEVLLRMLAGLKERGVACIYISHRLEEVRQLADRITVLRDGAAVATFPAATDETVIVRHMVGREIDDLYAYSAPAPGPVMLAAEALSVEAPDGRPCLRDVSFELRAGEVLGIGGLMGAGRSELLMHLYGAFGRRTAGRVLLDGAPLATGDPRSSVAAGLVLVTEDRRRYGFHDAQPIGFNLSLSSLGSLSRAGIIDFAREAAANHRWYEALGIRASGLAAIAGRLSGGNQQKVVLGRALMTQPRVVLLDEPTRGIDIGAKLEIYALVRQLTRDGCAVLLVSSELPELLGLSDRVLMLRDGIVAGTFTRAEATPERLMAAALGVASRPAA